MYMLTGTSSSTTASTTASNHCHYTVYTTIHRCSKSATIPLGRGERAASAVLGYT